MCIRDRHIGVENFAAKIAVEAKKYKKVHSELMEDLNKIVRFTSFFILPLGILLFIHSYFFLQDGFSAAVNSTSAALLGMLPKGLVLLTSVSLVLGVIKLARRKTLVQELFCICLLYTSIFIQFLQTNFSRAIICQTHL